MKQYKQLTSGQRYQIYINMRLILKKFPPSITALMLQCAA